MDYEDDSPVTFPLRMKASFREKATKEQAVGSPIRWRTDDDVLMQGVVVGWTDEEDGGVTLTIEGSAPSE